VKAFLMYRDRDFELDRTYPPHHADLTQDLGLEQVLEAMAAGDKFLLDVARKAVLTSLTDPGEIAYRQAVLNDCVANPATVEEIYAVAVAAIEGERKIWRGVFRYAGITLSSSIEALQLFISLLKKLRVVADQHADSFHSEGFTRFFSMLKRELGDEYFRSLDEHLHRLKFRHGVLISARLGKGNRGVDYVLRKPRPPQQGWRQWIAVLDTLRNRSDYSLVIGDRDESGARALSELRDRGIDLAANALAQSTDHILSFFTMLRAELAFYVGSLNLRKRLVEKGEPVCFPEPVASGRPTLSCRGLYDVGLSLRVDGRVVGNDVSADGKVLIMITGANQGGKSTFLRSIGLAQLMMQAGMFAGAEAFRASVCDALFTHYKREEDPTMKSGKLDEELSRMSAIADRVTPNSMMLFNESFSATNEREGAEIAGSIVRSLLDAGLKIFFVTHSFELANGFYGSGTNSALFLRADRRADGTRTFRLLEGEPLPTSYGEDLYQRIFGEVADAVPDRSAEVRLGERQGKGATARNS
jgi:DNA mismatch repair ATPase MutS